jgi:hypothetical protein
MNNVNFGGNSIDSDDKKQIVKQTNNDKITKPVDYFSIKSAFQAMIIQKTMEANDILATYLRLTHPLAKMTLAFALFNPYQTMSLLKTNGMYAFSIGMWCKRSITALIYRKPQPVKKTFEICYITDNSINHLYVAFDWYLKTNSKVKKQENHSVLSMTKPIEPSKKDKDYPVLKTVPEEQETEFIYDNYTFSYSKTSYDDFIYAPSGEMKKKNHKLLIWSYDCTDASFDNLSSHVINSYAKSKVDEVWIQKLHTHENGMWKDSVIDRNKRKINSVVMKNGKNNEISSMLRHFSETEEWHLERGIPYKKSFLFYGPPGTGKSSMIKAMSFELQRHIHYLNLSLIKNDQELTNLMSKINFKETIIVIEDIDAQGSVVHTRKKEDNTNSTNNTQANTSLPNTSLPNTSLQNQTQIDQNQLLALTTATALLTANQLNQQNDSNGTNSSINGSTNGSTNKQQNQVTLSGILNQIDGVHNNHGMILIMTTNYPEKLDEALIRDGRVDERVFFDYCDYDQIYQMFKNFYNGNSLSLEQIKSNLNLTKQKVAPCNVENAMRRYYSDPVKALDDIINSSNKKSFEKFEI